MLRNRDFQVVLMDMQMPVMGGIEATRAIRTELGKDVPVIALTAAAMKEDREAALDAGMDDYLIKPVTGKALQEKLRQWVGRTR